MRRRCRNHDFEVKDQVTVGLVRRVCRHCGTVSIVEARPTGVVAVRRNFRVLQTVPNLR